MSLVSTLKFITSHPLSSRKPLGAVGRFVRWQLASRLIEGEFVFPWVGNARFKVRRGQTGLTGNIYTGLHEFEDMAFLLHYLRPEDLFVDVGANVGSYTILAGAAVGSKCIAIEPVPATFECLVENVRLNRREPTTECINAAVGSDVGTLRFTANLDTVNHAVADREIANAVEVPVRTLDSVLYGRRPTLVKIDVEGYETPVIQGGMEALSNEGPLAVIMEMNGSGQRYGFDEAKLQDQLIRLGFSTYRYLPFERRLERIASGIGHGGNTIFVRDEAFAQERIRSAPPIVVQGRSL